MIAVAALLAGCASSPQPTGRSQVDAVATIIEQDYYKTVSRPTLLSGCLAALDSSSAAPAQTPRSPGTMEDVAAALSRAGGGHLQAAIDRCLHGMVGTLEHRSAEYISREESAERRQRHAALGLELAIADEGARVVSVVEDGPAGRASLRPGALLLQVDGLALKDRPLRDVYRLLRGEVGSSTKLELRDDDSAPARSLTLVRQVVTATDGLLVNWAAPGIALVRIPRFGAADPGRLATRLGTLLGASAESLEGIVLDLRGNTGGLLDASVATAAAFLPPGVRVVSTVGRRAEHAEHHIIGADAGPPGARALARLPATVRTAPMVVMVSRTTASGGEVVAAALQDHRRAKVLGWPTAGLGLVQTVQPLAGGAVLQLATSSMWRPNGAPLQGLGVTPDVSSAHGLDQHPRFGPASRTDPMLAEALRLVKAAVR
ncbi:MAG: hypothetical protein JNJ89_06180 [Rubrivivax sp.]|nr:hypothetical protein [Rubrivivax sp.]